MAPKYTLTYFGIAGRGETVRLMFHAAGVEFTDNRVKFPDWQSIKGDATRFPIGQMPTLQVDEKLICQSNAIYRYVARELGLYGDNSMDQAVIDQVTETLEEMLNKFIPIMFGGHDEETKKTKFAELFSSEMFKKQFIFIQNMLKNNKTGFFVGSKLSYADIRFFDLTSQMTQANPDALKDYPELNALVDRVRSNENIKKYLGSQK